MKQFHRSYVLNIVSVFTMIVLCTITVAPPAVADGYENALKGVKGIKAVFDYSQGSPKMSNLILGAVKGIYEDEATTSLPEKTQLVILFQGPAVTLITTDRSNFPEKDFAELDKLHELIRQLKKDGVKLEVCLYAANVMGVDPSTILPEIDQVGNGFISTIGYQTQGYSLVRVP
jgi:intracellular sulfur oxidation DsrE/DsrF family protein